MNPLAYAIKNFPLDIDLIESNPEFKCLLEGCLHPDYNKRPTAEELFNNPFLISFSTTLTDAVSKAFLEYLTKEKEQIVQDKFSWSEQY